ncbi:MAG: YIP1 family protein [Rubrobacter sp.]
MDFNTGSGGTEGSGGSSSGPGGGSPRAAASTGGEFDYRDPVQSFISTVRNVVTAPAGFFRGIVGHTDLVNPLIFAIICSLITAILVALLGLIGVGERTFGSLLGGLLFIPISVAIGLFIGAGIFHLLVMLIVGSRNAGFAGTFRVAAYSSVTSLVSWIPIIGFIASLYGLYLAIVGLREVHNTSTGKAVIIVLLPSIVILLLVLLIVGAALLVLFGASQG